MMASQSAIDRGYNAAFSSLTGQGLHPNIIVDTEPCFSLLCPEYTGVHYLVTTVVSRGPKQVVSLNSPSAQMRITVHLSGSGKSFL